MAKLLKEAQAMLHGVGADIGTMNVVSARKTLSGVETKRVRDAFLELPIESKKMLRLANVSYVERGDELLILGDAAMDTANMFGREARRPLSAGLISSSDIDAMEILGLLVKNVLGDPRVPGEHCYFSVPAAPVDRPDQDVIYHRGVLEKIVRECGYTPTASNEAMAIIFSEAAKENFSGIALSFGCLTPETPIITRDGWQAIRDVREGDSVLTREGRYGRVVKTWQRQHDGEVYKISFYGNPEGVCLTGNHQVWVQRDGIWAWIRAEELRAGDVVGEPVVSGYGERRVLSLWDKDRNGPAVQQNLDWSSSLGRFLGYFLADGHLQSSDVNREGRYEVIVDFGPGEDSYVEDLRGLVDGLFKRSMTVVAHGNAQRCSFSHGGLHAWLKANCYDKQGQKRFPLEIETMKPSVVEGCVVGMVRGDGWVTDDAVKFGNSSLSLITAFHLLVGRMGLTSTITRRDPRGAVFGDGRVILAENCKDEWTVHITGWDGRYLKEIVETPADKRSPRVWKDGGMRCTRIRGVEAVPYSGVVHDLTIEGDPSFCAPYITLHNSGMTNVAMAMNTLEGLSFSVARAGDWIDHGAAKSIGSTGSRLCAIKEKGIDLNAPAGRGQEALTFYYKNLIEYVIDQFALQFAQVAGKFSVPKPIPIIVSGGTSKAGGFLDLFKSVFDRKRKRFPVEVSEVRAATDPLNAVANGLLVQAMQENE